MPYEFDGERYKKASTHQKEWGERLISELHLKGDERILDLGCGDGVLTHTLSTLVPNGIVLGIDASEGMINVAKKLESGELSFALMDINDLQLDQKFDLIFSNAALHWIKDHKKLWSAIEHLLSPGGTVRFNFAADGNSSHFFRTVKETMGQKRYEKYFADFVWPWYMPTLDEYGSLLANYTFSKIDIWGENADRYFPDRDSLIRWIEQPSIVPFLPSLPQEEREAFKDTVMEKMVHTTAQKDGRYFETFRRINVLVVK